MSSSSAHVQCFYSSSQLPKQQARLEVAKDAYTQGKDESDFLYVLCTSFIFKQRGICFFFCFLKAMVSFVLPFFNLFLITTAILLFIVVVFAFAYFILSHFGTHE